MSTLSLKIPSKTFIVGEYLALKGGGSLIVTTHPCFEIQIKLGSQSGLSKNSLFTDSLSTDSLPSALHPESPSGLLVKKRKLQVQQFFINDPHEKKGGFGRSTAEFLSLYLASSALGSENDLKRNPKEINCEILRKTYQQLHADKQLHDKGLPPSGADLLAQSMGGISWVHPNESEFSSYSWPWSGQSFFVFRTGKKLPTHNHLQNLKLNSSHRLEILASKVFQSFRQKNWRPFVDGVNLYSDHLHELGLADEEVRERCLQLRNHNFVDGAKGCGAMGLDTVLVLGKIENKESIFQVAKKLDLQFVASSTDVYQISSEKINGDHAKKLDTERGL